jgi:hypothetical protein
MSNYSIRAHPQKEHMKSSLSKRPISAIVLTVMLLATLVACNLANPTSSNPPTNPPAGKTNADTGPVGSPSISHSSVPADKVPPAFTIANDDNTQPAASLHYAISGDLYPWNRFERPFTQTGMNYLPALDIRNLQIAKDPNWYYGSLQLAGVDETTKTLNANYALELDLNKDGRGDVLMWARPPFTTTWSTTPVTVYTDPDGDVGGADPLKADTPPGGDGYEKIVFQDGQGQDPDLVWVRISPDASNILQFAFKYSLLNGAATFMIGGWADSGLQDPGKFNYDDHFTLTDAGSSLHGDKNYPIKAIFAVDSTCRAAVGFTPKGTEPLVCPLPQAPTPTPQVGPRPTPTPIPTRPIG